ncbi:ComEC/Rec2 family competence protein [Maribellus sediminis]|uniref:ComEC/Rec2 family competence protein n=1 Tax=Maribellus sediminis TaxID=2696285 RepID=UPI001430B3EE|nr:ComEC/Rec2 family competence protein [Maribellus sediminis]
MKNLVQKIPSLRITLAFAVGILIANKFAVAVTSLLIAGTVILILIAILNRFYSFRFETVFGWLVTALFVLLGSSFYTLNNQTPTFYEDGVFWGTVLEAPEEKPKSYKSLVQIDAVKDSGHIFKTNEKVLVYFEKSEAATKLKPGSTILFSRVPELIRNNGNPYEFDYKKYLSRKKIHRRTYLAESDWSATPIQKRSVKTVAENAREKLLHIYREKNLGTSETEILSALTLGYKRGLDPETKQTFSAAGAMHVLAVSGLHVGIIFGIFAFLFGFLQKQKRGKYFYVILAVSVLWGYAFITGLSPSVMRAAAMFSLVCIAGNIQRQTNIYNTLTVSAFLLLLLNPNNLFEVGFQLSYAAVFGIVYLQPKIAGLIEVKTKVGKFFWALLTVSVAAQIATFPLTAYYFNQFPLYFWLSNLVVIPAVFVLIALGIALLLLSSVPILSGIVAFLTGWAVKLVYVFLERIENLPYAVQNISLTKSALFLVISFLLFTFLFIERKRVRHIKLMLLALIILAASNLAFQYKQLHNSELIVYNNSPNAVIQLISSKTNYVLSEQAIDSSNYILRQINTVIKKQRLDQPTYLTLGDNYSDSILFLHKNVIDFEGKIIWFDHNQQKIPAELNPAFVVSTKSTFENLCGFSDVTVVSTAYPKPTDSQNIHFLRSKGAFYMKW